jgi:hypothetical protein
MGRNTNTGKDTSMGYTTTFQGVFRLNRPLERVHYDYLKAFSGIRHIERTHQIKTLPDPVREAAGIDAGPQGIYYVGGDESSFLAKNCNALPDAQSHLSYYCDWEPTEDGTGIKWNGAEKFYCYVEWLEYLMVNFLHPWGYTLTGVVSFCGEDPRDRGTLDAEKIAQTLDRKALQHPIAKCIKATVKAHPCLDWAAIKPKIREAWHNAGVDGLRILHERLKEATTRP